MPSRRKNAPPRSGGPPRIQYTAPQTRTGPVQSRRIGGGQTLDEQISMVRGQLKRATSPAQRSAIQSRLDKLLKTKKGK